MTTARIATVCQARQFQPSVDENRAYVLRLLDLALKNHPDLVCLPETFTTVSERFEESVPGPTTDAIAERARANSCYIVCPIRNTRDGKIWNSAVIIDRQGQIAGIYDKAQPVTSSADYSELELGATPGPRDVPVFDLDFGRVGIQICFDAGFPETWQKLADKGARMVLWPSAYNGGFPLQAYAYIHHFYVVTSVRTDKSRIINPLGEVLACTDERNTIIYQDLNLDFCVSHYDWNLSIPELILANYGDKVRITSERDSGHFMIEPMDNTITVAQLQNEFGFECTQAYHNRHRDIYDRLSRGKDLEPTDAPHGDRPMHGKWF